MSSGDPKSDLPTWLYGMAIGLALILLVVLSYELGQSRGEKEAREAIAAGYTDAEFLKLAGVKVKKAEAESAAPAAEEKPKPSGPGLESFKTTCGGCHTLAAAGTSGTSGPNLDQIKPDDALVHQAIANGGSGTGAMPKGLLSGKQADAVAEFVAEYAGQQ